MTSEVVNYADRSHYFRIFVEQYICHVRSFSSQRPYDARDNRQQWQCDVCMCMLTNVLVADAVCSSPCIQLGSCVLPTNRVHCGFSLVLVTNVVNKDADF